MSYIGSKYLFIAKEKVQYIIYIGKNRDQKHSLGSRKGWGVTKSELFPK